jgi:tripartite-type tricarboxylate transporter receptor subunit TctC
LALAHPALAEPWPAKSIRVVAPYPPGGATDITARIYGRHLQESLGQPVVIENRAGAGGELGAEFVARAAPDGYTLLFGAIGSLAIHAVIPSQRPPYALFAAFVGVSMRSSVPLAVAVRDTLGVSSLEELLAMARARPGSLTYGSAGNGSTQHLTGEHFKQRAEVDLLHVPYRGSGPAVNDLLGGQIDLAFDTLPALSPAIPSGRIRLLAVTSAARAPMMAETPTLDELGLKGFDVSTLYGLLAPRGTPGEIVERLSHAMQDIARMPEVRTQLASQGAEAIASTPAETDALIRREVNKWSEVASTAKLDWWKARRSARLEPRWMGTSRRASPPNTCPSCGTWCEPRLPLGKRLWTRPTAAERPPPARAEDGGDAGAGGR